MIRRGLGRIINGQIMNAMVFVQNLRLQRPLTRRRARGCLGMTLMEILIVVVLMSAVSLVIYNGFSNGIKVWKRSHALRLEEDAAIFFEKLAGDLRNVYIHTQARYEGGDHRFRFPAIIMAPANTPSTEDPRWESQLGEVEYAFDLADRRVIRRVANYGQMVNDEPGEMQTMLDNVQALRFRYVFFTDMGQEVRDAVTNVFPVGLNIELEYTNANAETVTITRMLDIPLSL
jgi:hypothetical protein